MSLTDTHQPPLINLPLLIQDFINMYSDIYSRGCSDQQDAVEGIQFRLGKAATYIIAKAFKELSGEQEVMIFDNGEHAYIAMGGCYYDVWTMVGHCTIQTDRSKMRGYNPNIKIEMSNVDGMFNATFDNGHQYHNSVARGFLKRWKIELPPRLLVG